MKCEKESKRMNGGIIANRYAKAFYQWTESRSTTDAVYEQLRVILSAMGNVPKMAATVGDSHGYDPQVRLGLLEAALGEGVTLHPDVATFWKLMEHNGRSEYFRLSMLDYLQFYRDTHDIIMLQITSAYEDPPMKKILEDRIKKNFNKTAIITHRTDPSIIGGFISDTWGWRLDASVKTALRRISEQLFVNDKRQV